MRGRQAARWGAFIRDVDRFDAVFFGLAPREAQATDPQHRLLLEVCWEALEDAGIPLHAIAGTSAGVFIGASTNDYATMQLADLRAADAYVALGSSNSYASGRVSYFFDLRGPSAPCTRGDQRAAAMRAGVKQPDGKSKN